MNKIILLVLLSFSCYIFSQEIPVPIDEGIVTITTNQRIPFKKMRKEGIEIVFYNILTRSDYRYLPNTIKKIEDKELNILYINPKFENEPNIREKYVPLISKLFKPEYPDGIYLTKEDFINKTPSNELVLLGDKNEPYRDDNIVVCEEPFFYYKETQKKVKNVFAVSHNGFLYFQIKAILNNRNKTDRAQRNDYPQSFVRVKSGGDNYYYTESELVNLWAESLTFAATGNYALAESLSKTKGIVWDFKNKEFNIFKNCEDFNNFIKSIDSQLAKKCETQQPDIKWVREVIEKIK